ncbi:MAG: ATP-binding protein [Deltaproteobacteria bacterium]|nr:ATP-binding protein [Deltaproteobacteria bacterium]
MQKISKTEIINKIKIENPWWNEDGSIDEYFRQMKPRAYLDQLYGLITETAVNRAVALMGPRRVGKTVLLYHAIQRLIENGVPPKHICYISIEAPVYIGLRLEQILEYYAEIFNSTELRDCYLFLDEIQYLKDWELHLKKLVENYRSVKFIASGSAAAALRLKSMESGAGRFTHFHLPPLTFYEYLYLLEKENLIRKKSGSLPDINYESADIHALNHEFIHYLNFGGYPEAIFSEAIKADTGRYIRSDIIDKVLLRDLPGLYGIQDIQELNRLFTMLAYNTGNEVSLDELSKGSGVAKNTIKKYLEYLEAAFLIKTIHRIDQAGKRFSRANYFKVYLTNPSMRCALFGPISAEHDFMGNMAETAIVSQWLHSSTFDLYYSRWKGGEVDLVYLLQQKINWCVEIKWTNRYFERPEELKSLISLAQKHNLQDVTTTTVDKRGHRVAGGITIEFLEAGVYCYAVGKNSTEGRSLAGFKV